MNDLTSIDPAKARAFFAARQTFTTRPREVKQALADKKDIVVVDVRAAADFEKGHVPGAVSLPPDKWSSAEGLSKEKVNVVYCYSHACHLAGAACAALAGRGYPVVEMDGGYDIWQSSELEVET